MYFKLFTAFVLWIFYMHVSEELLNLSLAIAYIYMHVHQTEKIFKTNKLQIRTTSRDTHKI